MPTRGPLPPIVSERSPKPSPGWREGGAWRGMTSDAGTGGGGDGQLGAAVSAEPELRGPRASGSLARAAGASR